MYVYTETGILVDRILYRDISEKCGKPVGISENGQNLIFRQSEIDPMLHMVEVTIRGLHVRKTFNINEAVSKCISEISSSQLN